LKIIQENCTKKIEIENYKENYKKIMPIYIPIKE